ncbi:cytochrome P450 71A9-like [Hibiscus syriacus]|uniref:Cytochrome P450 71A9-like n=1 Tax=Hibiscus syriacus TaxID=106335 RepID=A0A6A2Z5X2_HIBSY|nr:cytochrome P450 71A9-like [Hibiscus syriacus]
MTMKFDIEKFNGRNFSLWKLKMKAILRKDGSLATISERPVDFTDDNKWIEMDRNAMSNFHLVLADKLTSLRCTIGEQKHDELLLQSLPDLYDQLIINLTNSNITSLVFDDVATIVLQEENRHKNKEDRQVNLQQAEALTTTRGRSTERGQSNNHKHGRSKSRSKKNLKCYNCGKKGHLKKDCWSLNKNSNPQGNTANISDDGPQEENGSIIMNLSQEDLCIKLGHMSEQGMKVLVEQMLPPGLTKISLPLCEHCITITSLGGAKYFVSFIDDYFRRCWVYPIKKKSDVFSTFKNFKARVKLDYGNKIKCFRTDNGGEYTSKEFDDFYIKEDIKRQFTVANTPQQNGVAERMNITLLERTRAMLRDTGLEKSLWAEAVNTACYLVNRAPSTAIELKTPMEMWTGKLADYSNLHIFGSIVYVMYNSQEISKLDPKSRKCKFLGYADGVKGYRLWDSTAYIVIISRDVIFIEDKLQRKEDDDSAEKSETTQIHVEKEVEQGDSSEAEPTHDEQEPESSKTPTTRQSNRMRDVPIGTQIMKPIGNKWVFKIKRNGDDQVERYRARLVVKGYAQKEGIDFNEIFSPVVRLTTVRVVLAMCATLNLYLEQLDVKTTFLHENLEEEIYMLQPESFEEKEKKNLVCRLNKSLYGLKQAPRCWYKRFDSFIMCLGYNRLNADPCAYFKRSGDNDFVILLLYVDDILVAGPNKYHIEELKAQLAREFEMKDLGSANKILGMQIHRDRSNRKIWLSQKNYLKKNLSRFSMQDCKPIYTPLPINFKLSSNMSPSSEEEMMEMSRVSYVSAVGSLMFAMICTRPYIAQAVGVLSRYMANPGKEHWNTVKRILRYIKGTPNVALCYGGSNLLINRYVDSDYAEDLDKNKSTTRYVFKVASGAVEEGTVDMQKIHTKDNIADFMTKAINADKFTWCLSSCGLSETALQLFQYLGINLVLYNGKGRAFCAGGDVAAVVHDIRAGGWRAGANFFMKEYTLNYLMATYSKPQVSILNGIIMGGGNGTSMHGRFRVATENSLFAMPETALGLFPDVGASYSCQDSQDFSHPGFWLMPYTLTRKNAKAVRLREYLGLTGAKLDGAEMLACGLATHFVPSAVCFPT